MWIEDAGLNGMGAEDAAYFVWQGLYRAWHLRAIKMLKRRPNKIIMHLDIAKALRKLLRENEYYKGSKMILGMSISGTKKIEYYGTLCLK